MKSVNSTGTTKHGFLTRIASDRVLSLLLTVVVVIVVSGLVWPDKFFTFSNFSNVLLGVSIESIVAVGMMILMISGAFDLSVGAVVALSGGVTANLMNYQNVDPAVAILAGLLVAIIIGIVNGLFVSIIGINAMIQTLAMMGIARGFALMASGGGIPNLPAAFNTIGQTKLLGLQSPVYIMAVIVIVFAILVSKTVFFRRNYYIGGNEKAAFLSGINVKKMMMFNFILSSFLAGVAGILLTSRLGMANSSSGTGLELKVITAVILGGASLKGGQGNIWGAILGTVFMGLMGNIMIIARVPVEWQQIVTGAILILAVTIDVVMKKRQSI